MRRDTDSVKRTGIQVSRSSSKRGVLATAIALALPLVVTLSVPVLAQDAGASQASSTGGAQSQQAYQLDIPAKSLPQAIADLSAVTGLQVLYTEQSTFEHTASALQGSYTVRDALQQLLAGSGLVVRFTGENSVTIEMASQDGAMTLPPVQVAGSSIRDGSAETGYLAEEISQIGPWQGRKLQELPYSITTVSSDLIENLQATSSDQVFRVNPTTQVTRLQFENDQTFVNMRGFRVNKFYRDGMPGGQYGQGTTTEDVERIEILSGLSGFMYGPGNVGGVINYVSKRPTGYRMNKLTVGNNGGSNYYFHGDFGGPIDKNGRFGYRINAVLQDGETAIEPMEIKKEFVSAAFDWHITDDLLLQFNAADREYQFDGRQAPFSMADGLSRPSASRLDASRSYGQPWTTKKLDNQRLGANVRWDAAESLTFRAAWSRDEGIEGHHFTRNTLNGDGTYDQQIFGVYPDGVDDLLTDKSDTRGQGFADFQFKTGSVSHKLTFGAQFSRDVQRRYDGDGAATITFENLTLPKPDYLPKPDIDQPASRGLKYVILDTKNTSWILGDDIVFSDQWSLLAGLAKTKIEVDKSWSGPYSDSAITPTVSLLYKPRQWLTTYVSYVESLEQGGQAGEEFNGVPVANAGEVFEPMRSEQVELGVKATLGQLALSAAIFDIDKSLQYYDLTDSQRPKFVQDGRQAHRGIEFSAIGALSERWAIIGGFTLLDAEVKKQTENPQLEGNRPGDVAERFAKLRSEYRVPAIRGLTLIGGISFEGDKFADIENRDRMSAYTLVDLGARYDTSLNGNALSLRAELRNATDKHYWVSGFSGLGEPRTLVFSASIEL